jgi:hypothetical protein
MANTFKSYQSTGITTEAVVFTGASGAQTTVIGLSIANTSTNPAEVSIKLNSAYIVKDAPVPVGGALVAVGGDQKVVVEASDTISVSSDETVDMVLSVLEIA